MKSVVLVDWVMSQRLAFAKDIDLAPGGAIGEKV
jgi:hypothetical protein